MTVGGKPDRKPSRQPSRQPDKVPSEDLCGKLVILKFDGTFQQGFRVLLEIGDEGDRPAIELAGALPPNLELATHLSEWQQHYHSLNVSGLNSRIQPQQIIYGGSVNRLEDCWRSATELHQQMSRWLASDSFRRLDLRLRESLSLHESIRVLLRTQDPLLRRLPWHLWDFIERYAKTEVALSAPVAERVRVEPLAEPSQSVKILAILGSSEEINVQADRQFLAALPDAQISFLVEPSRQAIAQQLWEQPWDILFFAGHSSTEGDRGLLYINPNESLSLEELRYGLKQAISKGLQLAIFNSCDGLGLAQSLESLHLPQMIVMREPVPDRVAQSFLKSLLAAFSGGKSLYLSVREAREQLQSIEDQFPCATWLPIICQNSTKRPPTWQTLIDGRASERSKLSLHASTSFPLPLSTGVTTRSHKAAQRFVRSIYKGWVVLLVSLLVTTGLVSSFAQTQLQPLELAVYDRMMQQRPDEGPDKHLLIIEITEADIAAQKENGELLKRRSLSEQSYGQTFETSLSDSSLSRLLETLAQYQPSVIGLDLYRDFAAGPNQSELSSRLQQDGRLIAVCKAEDFEDSSFHSIDPPPEMPLNRVGFSDFREDSDGILRRHLLGMLPLIRNQTSRCNTEQSFSLQIAAQYLSQRQIEAQITEVGDLRLGSQLVEILERRGNTYPPSDNAGGSDILLNYRSTPEIAPMVTLQQFLNQQPNPNYLKDTIVLVGVTTKDDEDHWLTPIYPDGPVPGVIVQSHMISQLLSAALDNRPLIAPLSPWQSVGWIWTWAVVGGFLALWRSPRNPMSYFFAAWIVSLTAASAFLYGICFFSLIRGHWVPFASLVVALVLSSVLVTIYLLIRSKVRRRLPLV